jgi:hypothetical protein
MMSFPTAEIMARIMYIVSRKGMRLVAMMVVVGLSDESGDVSQIVNLDSVICNNPGAEHTANSPKIVNV